MSEIGVAAVMHSVVVVSLVACAGAPHTSSDTRTLSGRVVDEHGAPIAGAEVLLCTYHSLCDSVKTEVVATSDSLVEIGERLGAASPRSTYGVTRTDAAGRWSLRTPVADPVNVASRPAALVTAIDREIAALPASDVARDVTLRPAAPLDLDLHCGTAPCLTEVTITGDPLARRGTHFAHLESGHHAFDVIANHNRAGEMYGHVEIDVSAVARRVPVELAPTGTGFAITGKVSGCAADARLVVARCGTGGSARYRYTSPRSGVFEIDDVPSPPCTVAVTGDPGYWHRDRARPRPPNSDIVEHDVTVSHLPASGLELSDPGPEATGIDLDLDLDDPAGELSDEEMATLAEISVRCGDSVLQY